MRKTWPSLPHGCLSLLSIPVWSIPLGVSGCSKSLARFLTGLSKWLELFVSCTSQALGGCESRLGIVLVITVVLL